MAAIGGASLGVLTGYTLLDQATGESKAISEILEGGAGTPGPAGLGISTITSSQSGSTVTLTFKMTDDSEQTATFTIPSA